MDSERHRRWTRQLAGICPPPTTPRVVRTGEDWTGESVLVRVAAGSTVTDLANLAETLAACFDVEEVRVRRHPRTAAYATIQALRIDPLQTAPTAWPWSGAPRCDLWWPVPVGLDEDGNHVTIGLVEHNLLLGGEPGSGKSVALSQLVAAAALDPNVNLYLLDGKLVELAAWAPLATATAGVAIGDAIDVLRRLQTVMDARYQELLELRLRKQPPGSRLHVVVIDELAHYLTWPDKKPRDAFTDTLRDLVSRGRAAGIIVIAATQKPASDVIPTSLRDLFGYRWALRCATNAASDTILGTGWATTGVTAATIKPAARGSGWLLHETGTPIRLRAHHLTDPDLHTLAWRATQLRHHINKQAAAAAGPSETAVENNTGASTSTVDAGDAQPQVEERTPAGGGVTSEEPDDAGT